MFGNNNDAVVIWLSCLTVELPLLKKDHRNYHWLDYIPENKRIPKTLHTSPVRNKCQSDAEYGLRRGDVADSKRIP